MGRGFSYVVYGSGADKGTQGDAVILQTVAQLELLHLLLHCRAEGVVHAALDPTQAKRFKRTQS